MLNEAGLPTESGEVGELVHRGPTVAAGYWQDSDATARVFRPYPFSPPGSVAEYVVYSGDYVCRDEDGWLYYVGRRDEQFKSRGFRVNPTEIEMGLLGSELLTGAVVFAEPNEDGDLEIVAAVVPADPVSFELDLIEMYCRRALPAHQVPSQYRVLSELPRTPSGKIDRATVKAQGRSPTPTVPARRPPIACPVGRHCDLVRVTEGPLASGPAPMRTQWTTTAKSC